MAELFDEAKTEAPTPKRREEARAEGQVARSPDLAASLVLLAGLAFLTLAGGTLGRGMLASVADDLCNIARFPDLGAVEIQELLGDRLRRGLELVGLLCILAVLTALGAGALQVGIQMTPQLIAINWERVSPAQGWARLFSSRTTVRGLLALCKAIVILGVAYWIVARIPSALWQPQERLASSIGGAWRAVLQLGLAVAAALVALGTIDYGWQRWKLEQSLRMSRPEVKEEMKREQGDPQVKLRIRKLQRQAAQKRMLKDVAKATVVITNPTHLAVALRYDRLTMAAPRVVAKGAGAVAERIVERARRHAVIVLERKPLAQALFKAVKIGHEIPVALYQAVAEVLAFVFKLRSA